MPFNCLELVVEVGFEVEFHGEPPIIPQRFPNVWTHDALGDHTAH